MISHESICGFSSIGCAGVVIFYEKTCFVSDVFHCVSMKLVLGDLLVGVHTVYVTSSFLE